MEETCKMLFLIHRLHWIYVTEKQNSGLKDQFRESSQRTSAKDESVENARKPNKTCNWIMQTKEKKQENEEAVRTVDLYKIKYPEGGKKRRKSLKK